MRTMVLSEGDEELLMDVLQTFIEFSMQTLDDKLIEPDDVESTRQFLLDVMEFSQHHDLLGFEGIEPYEVKLN